MTKVLFRKWRKGRDIYAIFPELPGTNDPATCSCYSHIGQHSSCDSNYYLGKTVPATPEEYADLLTELKSIGYDDLVIVKKMTQADYEARKREIGRISEYPYTQEADNA